MMVWLDAVHPERMFQMQRDRSTGGAGRRRRAISKKELRDLWDTRCSLETVAARLACEHADEEDLRELRQLAADRAEAAMRNDADLAEQHDLEFHRTLIRLSGNSVIEELFATNPLCDDSNFCDPVVSASRADVQRVLDTHARLIDAIAAGNEDKAEAIMRDLLESEKQRCLEQLPDDDSVSL